MLRGVLAHFLFNPQFAAFLCRHFTALHIILLVAIAFILSAGIAIACLPVPADDYTARTVPYAWLANPITIAALVTTSLVIAALSLPIAGFGLWTRCS